MEVLTISLPIFLLLGLGAWLGRIGMFTPSFTEAANRFIFRVSMPALIIASLCTEALDWSAAARPTLVMGLATLAVIAVACLAARLCGCPGGQGATLVQAAFRGNLAFVGLPVMASISAGGHDTIFTDGVLVFAPVMVIYNVLAVLLFHFASERRGNYRRALSGLASNPLILATLVGGAIAVARIPVPEFLRQTVGLLGAPAAPLALLCIGASMAEMKFGTHLGAAIVASLLKVLICPLLAWLVALACGLTGTGLLIVMIFAACPTATASYVFARELGGDPTLASKSVVLSTLFSAISLTVTLALFLP